MKFSHHGAATSTPHNLLDNFNPVNITISQGKHKGLGHLHMLIFSRYTWYRAVLLIIGGRLGDITVSARLAAITRGQRPKPKSQFSTQYLLYSPAEDGRYLVGFPLQYPNTEREQTQRVHQPLGKAFHEGQLYRESPSDEPLQST